MRKLKADDVANGDFDEDSNSQFDQLSENLILQNEYIQNRQLFTRLPEQVHPDPDQPRKTFDNGELKQLAESMDESGQSQPIKVYLSSKHNRLEILFGESRYRAKRDYCANRDIDCILVDEPTEEEKYNIRVDENLRRKQFTVDELLDITVRYHGIYSDGGFEDVNRRVSERLKIAGSEVSRRLTVHRARRHHDDLIGDAFGRLVETGSIDNMTTLYSLGASLLTEGTDRLKNPARDLILKALDSDGVGGVTKKQAEEAHKQANKKKPLSYKWKPKFLELPDNEKDKGNTDDDQSEAEESIATSPSDDDTDAKALNGAGTGADAPAPGQEKPEGRVLKTLSVQSGAHPNYLKIKANTGYITKHQAIEFANALLKSAEDMQ
jgi:ParB/RepB/Spo0J family partition protein